MNDEGDLSSFARIEADSELARINDAKCDSRGRLWAGTLTSNFRSGGGALYRIDPDGAVKTVLPGVTLANGLDWSPDETTFYFVDSFTRSVDAFDFDVDRGEISQPAYPRDAQVRRSQWHDRGSRGSPLGRCDWWRQCPSLRTEWRVVDLH